MSGNAETRRGRRRLIRPVAAELAAELHELEEGMGREIDRLIRENERKGESMAEQTTEGDEPVTARQYREIKSRLRNRVRQLESEKADLLAACELAREALVFVQSLNLSQFERGWNEEISDLDAAIAKTRGGIDG